MPTLPLVTCNVPHCRNDVKHKKARYCIEHDRAAFKNRAKYETDMFYKTGWWRKFRAFYLAMAPLCRACEESGVYTKANILDHIIPRSIGGADYDLNNLLSKEARKRGKEMP